MPKFQVTCPECDATLALRAPAPAGKRIRCPRCEAVFAVPDRATSRVEVEERDVDERRPSRPLARRKRRPQRQSSGALGAVVLVGVLGVSVVVALGVAVWLASRTTPGIPPPPTMARNTTPGKPRELPPPTGTGTEIGQLAQEIEGEDIDGRHFKLSDYRGKVVVLDFWGHW